MLKLPTFLQIVANDGIAVNLSKGHGRLNHSASNPENESQVKTPSDDDHFYGAGFDVPQAKTENTPNWSQRKQNYLLPEYGKATTSTAKSVGGRSSIINFLLFSQRKYNRKS